MEPVVEILAEAARLHLGLGVLVGGGDDAHVDLHRLGAAHRADLAVLEHAQELALDAEPHFADLVEEDGSPVRLLEEPALRRVRTGKRSPDVSEELALEQPLGNRHAVDRDEGLVGASAVVVDRAGHDFLARSAVAGDEHAASPVGDLPDQGEDVAHGRALADEIAEGARLVHRPAQPLVLLFEDAPLDGALEGEQRHLGLEGLGDVVESAGAHGFHCRVDASEGGHENDGGLGADSPQLAHHLDAGLSGHPDVAQDGVELDAPRLPERLVRGARLPNLVSMLLEQRREHLPHRGIVVDHQQGSRFCHGALPLEPG